MIGLQNQTATSEDHKAEEPDLNLSFCVKILVRIQATTGVHTSWLWIFGLVSNESDSISEGSNFLLFWGHGPSPSSVSMLHMHVYMLSITLGHVNYIPRPWHQKWLIVVPLNIVCSVHTVSVLNFVG